MYKKLFKPTYLKELCQQYQLSPSKKYGQNYLTNKMPIKKMIEVADIKETDTVVEIGPGFGVLTFALAEKAEEVVAFEIEKKLKKYWEENKLENLKIIWGNVLNQYKVESVKYKDFKVVANLPYQITSNILRTLLESENRPKSITVMVQKEVAERICAQPGNMSLLAVSVAYYGEPKIITKVSRGNFWPSPNVDSAVLHINTKTPSPRLVRLGWKKHKNTCEFDDLFFKVVKAGFKNKRKQLWRNLVNELRLESRKVKEILYNLTGDEKVRAQELSVEQWREVVNLLF